MDNDIQIAQNKKKFITVFYSQLWCISEIFLDATKNTHSTDHLILCLI
jgi:hypothetical protein